MSKEYIITCESTADLTAVSAKETGIPVLQQYFRIGEEHLEDTAEEQAERYQRCLAALRRGISPVAVKTGFSQYLILFAELIHTAQQQRWQVCSCRSIPVQAYRLWILSVPPLAMAC